MLADRAVPGFLQLELIADVLLHTSFLVFDIDA